MQEYDRLGLLFPVIEATKNKRLGAKVEQIANHFAFPDYSLNHRRHVPRQCVFPLSRYAGPQPCLTTTSVTGNAFTVGYVTANQAAALE
jgi:hypothetical protein